MIGRLRSGERALAQLGGVTVGGVSLTCPFMTASGTAGHDVELGPYMPLSRLGAVVVKSLFHEPWPGNPAPRVHLAGSGMINAVGLQGPGVHAWVRESLPRLDAVDAVVVPSIWGRTTEEYIRAAEALAPACGRIAAVEVNLSCPNLEGRSGIIAHDAEASARVIGAVSSVLSVPTWAKLSANTHAVVEVAESVSESGASAVVLVNTMLAMQLGRTTLSPSLGNGGGGLSGPPIHPIAVRCVYDVHAALPDVHIIGVGGIASGHDALEMMAAGATAVQVGTASFARPNATWRIAREAAWSARRHGATVWDDIIGVAHLR